jgi:ABC-type uncharacterized transport system permease subunit
VIRREVYTILVALTVAALAGALLTIVVGQSPIEVYSRLIVRTLGDGYSFGQVIFKSTPLIMTGLSVALAFHVGLFNIGAEGQMVAGSFATALCGMALPQGTPWPIALPLCVAAGMLAGGGLAAIPGVLKARYGAHEVINTIMLNFIAMAMVLWLGNEYLFLPETTHTADIVPGAHLSPLGSSGSAANTSFILAIVAAVLVHLFLQKTRVGFEWRAVGLSPRAAENGGVNVNRAIIGGMATAGALAGMCGANFVLGYKHYFEEGMGRGVGFMGIAVALLGRNHPIGIIAAALLFGTLSQGGLAVNSLVPKELVDVLQAVIILAVAATAATMRRRYARKGVV